jgi:hypothetical protein
MCLWMGREILCPSFFISCPSRGLRAINSKELVDEMHLSHGQHMNISVEDSIFRIYKKHPIILVKLDVYREQLFIYVEPDQDGQELIMEKDLPIHFAKMRY